MRKISVGQVEGADIQSLNDRSDIIDLVRRFVKEADKRNLEGMIGCVSEDVVMSLNGGELVLRGREEVRRFMSGQFADGGTLNPQTRGTHLMANTLVTLCTTDCSFRAPIAPMLT